MDPTTTRPATWLTRQETAARLGVSVRQVDRMVSAGRLTKHTRVVGRCSTVFAVSQVDALAGAVTPVGTR